MTTFTELSLLQSPNIITVNDTESLPLKHMMVLSMYIELDDGRQAGREGGRQGKSEEGWRMGGREQGNKRRE